VGANSIVGAELAARPRRRRRRRGAPGAAAWRLRRQRRCPRPGACCGRGQAEARRGRHGQRQQQEDCRAGCADPRAARRAAGAGPATAAATTGEVDLDSEPLQLLGEIRDRARRCLQTVADRPRGSKRRDGQGLQICTQARALGARGGLCLQREGAAYFCLGATFTDLSSHIYIYSYIYMYVNIYIYIQINATKTAKNANKHIYIYIHN